MSESANPGRSLLDQPILVFSRWSHLLSLRRESEPVKNPKNPEKKRTKTDTFQKPLESLSGNFFVEM